MAAKAREPSVTAGESSPTIPIGKSTASMSADMQEIRKKLLELIAQIPGMEAIPAGSRFPNVTVGNDFIEEIAVLLEAVPDVRAACGVDPEVLRGSIRYEAAYEPLARELGRVTRTLDLSILKQRSEAASLALRAYNFAKTYSRMPGRADLAGRVEEAKRKLGRRGNRRKTAAPKSAEGTSD